MLNANYFCAADQRNYQICLQEGSARPPAHLRGFIQREENIMHTVTRREGFAWFSDLGVISTRRFSLVSLYIFTLTPDLSFDQTTTFYTVLQSKKGMAAPHCSPSYATHLRNGAAPVTTYPRDWDKGLVLTNQHKLPRQSREPIIAWIVIAL